MALFYTKNPISSLFTKFKLPHPLKVTGEKHMLKPGVLNSQSPEMIFQQGQNVSANVPSQAVFGAFDLGNAGYSGSGTNKLSYPNGSQFMPTGFNQFNNNMMRGRGRGRGYFKPKLICQVCGKIGHSALQCYYRFDQDFQGFNYNHSVQASTYNPSISSQTNLAGVPDGSVQALFASQFVPNTGLHPNNGFHNSVLGLHDYSATVGSQMPQYPTANFQTLDHRQRMSPQPQSTTVGVVGANPTKAETGILSSSGTSYQAVATPQTVHDQSWYMDYGASNHMTVDASNLMHKSSYPGKSKVQVGNGDAIPITHTGMLLVPSHASHRILQLKNILCVPKIAKNLVSISQITKDNNVIVEFHSDHCLVKDKSSKAVLLQGSVKGGLYQLELSSNVSPYASSIPSASHHVTGNVVHEANVSTSDSITNVVHGNSDVKTNNVPLDSALLWHARLGHPNVKTLQYVLNKLHVKQSTASNKSSFCEACQFGKLKQCSFPISSSRASCLLELVYSDLWGPTPVMSREGYRYYVIFVDDFSRYTWIYPLKLKSEAYTVFVQFHNLSHKGYLCLASCGRLYIAQQVKFNETDFPFKNEKNESENSTNNSDNSVQSSLDKSWCIPTSVLSSRIDPRTTILSSRIDLSTASFELTSNDTPDLPSARVAHNLSPTNVVPHTDIQASNRSTSSSSTHTLSSFPDEFTNQECDHPITSTDPDSHQEALLPCTAQQSTNTHPMITRAKAGYSAKAKADLILLIRLY
ncbi:uncharacterized protein LOC116140680 [Pistacia vera]|uniref:uncharacterized protein LOC116140680 n=1 Tax=Pistacia vera TaxID=55513 RepID=UPI001262FCB4|nr:uncharacterized protein LOC116140680 [Pistacia vera]